MSYRSGRRRVVIWSIVLVFALCALMAGITYGPRLHWGISNRASFTTVKQQELAGSVSELRIDWLLGDIVFTQSQDQAFHILQKSEEHQDMIYFSVQEVGDAWEIFTERNVRWWDFFLGNAHLSDLEIQIPADYQGQLSVDTQGGDIRIESLKAEHLAIDSGAGDIEFSGTVQNVQLKSTSGDIEVKSGCTATQMSLQTSSGDIEIQQGEVGQLTVKTSSGDIEGKQLAVQQAQLETTSGDMELYGASEQIQANSTSGEIELDLTAQPEALALETTSGDIKVRLPKDSRFVLAFDTGSGDLKNDFAGQNTDQTSPLYTIQTSSGDCRIES